MTWVRHTGDSLGNRKEVVLKVRRLGKEIEVEYEKSGSYHIYKSITFNVEVNGLNRDKCYAKFIQALDKAVSNPKR